jgi:NAD(P)-dependent dehydrogenase (short-subunit alcohol dehydrogenase family)
MSDRENSGRLNGKVILLTGVGSGMGRALAIRYAQEGALVYGCDISEKGSAETLDIMQQQGLSMTVKAPVDLGDPEQSKAWIDEVGAVHGHVDVLYNNASSPRFAPMPDMSLDDWQYGVRNEIDLVFYAAKFAWPYLAKNGGVIISVGSTAAHVAQPKGGFVSHSAAKGAVLAMSKVFAVDGADFGIRSVTISPGGIRTPETQKNFLDKVPNGEAMYASMVPARRFGEVEDITGLAVFLASDEATYITGVDYLVDGGMTSI